MTVPTFTVEAFPLPVDPDFNPCVILKDLEAAKLDILLGKGGARRVRFRDDTGAEQEVDFGTAGNVAALDKAIARYKLLCAESLGLLSAPPQFCIIGR